MSDKDVELDLETGEVIENKEPEKEEPEDEHAEAETGTPEAEDDGGSGDEDDGEPDSDPEREEIRQRRREERQRKKQAQREREDTLRRELAARDTVINELRQKMDAFERRNLGSELAQIENGKKQATQAYQYFKDQIRLAGEAGNHAAVADATEKMIQAQRRFDEITHIEKAFKQRRATPQPLDPRLANHAKAWMDRNSWYDPAGRDQDSEIALRLDQRLAQEGWDPTTPEYWEELDSRIKKYLPHKANRAKMQNTKPRATVAGSGRESSTGVAAKSYRLSADRVQALKDAGIWDDAKQRAEAIKRFREYDKQQSQG